MAQRRSVEATIDVDGIEVCVEIEGDYEPFVPARISGPPEDCYPAEGGTFDITDIFVVDQKRKRTGQTIDLPGWITDRLAERYAEQMAEDDAYADAD